MVEVEGYTPLKWGFLAPERGSSFLSFILMFFPSQIGTLVLGYFHILESS